MPLYRVDRDMGNATAAELDAAVFRSVMCLAQFEQMVWRRSYYDPQSHRSACYYEAASAEDLRRHAALARIPCDAISEVVEYLPEQYR